jgi:hypothetical protein
MRRHWERATLTYRIEGRSIEMQFDFAIQLLSEDKALFLQKAVDR